MGGAATGGHLAYPDGDWQPGHGQCEPRFANARSVRNELERARLRHAHRLTSEPDRSWTRDDLMRIEPVDVFAGHDDLLAEPQQL